MKHLLSGLALAAVMAVAAPVWAESPAVSSTLPPATQATQAALPAGQGHPMGSVTGIATHASGARVATTSKRYRVVRITHHARYASQGYQAWHRHHGWHGSMSGGYGGGWSDHIANQLNGQEMGRIGGSVGGGYDTAEPPVPGYRSY